jgi:branched-chain amino acid transport system substrate-binding protein
MAEETREAGTTTSRRQFVKGAGIGIGAAILGPTGAAEAARMVITERAAPEANTLKIGFISPRTGPLAGFGEPDPYVVGLARKAFAKGLKVGGKS